MMLMLLGTCCQVPKIITVNLLRYLQEKSNEDYLFFYLAVIE